MEKENFRYKIIKSMVKNTPNDNELGEKVRNFFKEEELLDEEIGLEKYLKLIEGKETTKKSRFQEKLEEIKLKLKKRKDD